MLTGCAGNIFVEPVRCYEGKVWTRPYVGSDVWEPSQRTCKTEKDFK